MAFMGGGARSLARPCSGCWRDMTLALDALQIAVSTQGSILRFQNHLVRPDPSQPCPRCLDARLLPVCVCCALDCCFRSGSWSRTSRLPSTCASRASESCLCLHRPPTACTSPPSLFPVISLLSLFCILSCRVMFYLVSSLSSLCSSLFPLFCRHGSETPTNQPQLSNQPTEPTNQITN